MKPLSTLSALLALSALFGCDGAEIPTAPTIIQRDTLYIPRDTVKPEVVVPVVPPPIDTAKDTTPTVYPMDPAIVGSWTKHAMVYWNNSSAFRVHSSVTVDVARNAKYTMYLPNGLSPEGMGWRTWRGKLVSAVDGVIRISVDSVSERPVGSTYTTTRIKTTAPIPDIVLVYRMEVGRTPTSPAEMMAYIYGQKPSASDTGSGYRYVRSE